MRLPILDANDRSTVNLPEMMRMVDRFIQSGFNYFDTAHRYHDEASEPSIKVALTERYPRDSYEITNKVTMNYIRSKKDLMPFFQKQLELCGVTFFDNYLAHNMGESFYPLAIQYEVFDFLRELKRCGFVRRTGFSFHGSPEMLEQILTEQSDIDLVQLQINYLDWNDVAYRARESYEIARKFNKPIVVMEPIKGGTLVNLPLEAAAMLRSRDSQADFASWALRFVASLPGVYRVLSGMSSVEQMVSNIETMQNFTPLNDEEMAFMEQVATAIRKGGAIGCTNCRYCTTECPKNIPIPDFFALYNNMELLENKTYLRNQIVYYNNLIRKHGRAADCIECGLCEKNCPQHLPVRNLLKSISRTFDT